jgi:hypothetical protein
MKMNDVNKMTPEELAEEISQKAAKVIDELGNTEVLSKEQFKKTRGSVKRQLKEIKRNARALSKKMKATKGGNK